MKSLKGWLTGGVLVAMLLLGSASAKADSGSTTCNDGIIVGLLDGIIVGLGGDPLPCGTELTRDGLLISD